MAKYTVKFSCGHTQTIQLYGAEKERAKKIEYFREYGLCSACYTANRDAEMAKGCIQKPMKYADYKRTWYWCNTKWNSYSAKDKTIIVYIPQNIVDFESTVSKFAQNVSKMSKQEANMANAQMIKGMLESNKINQDQVKILVDVARKVSDEYER